MAHIFKYTIFGNTYFMVTLKRNYMQPLKYIFKDLLTKKTATCSTCSFSLSIKKNLTPVQTSVVNQLTTHLRPICSLL